MSDPISRQDVLKLIENTPYDWSNITERTEMLRKIKALPSTVVRCKDCKHWQDNNGGYPTTECRWGHDETPDADDFCSYGCRKENE